MSKIIHSTTLPYTQVYPSSRLSSLPCTPFPMSLLTACTVIAINNPPDWSKAAGKFSKPAPRPAFTIRNTLAYHVEPE